MCETERKERKIGDEKRVNSIPGAMDNVQRDKYPCLHCHAVKMASLLGSSYLCEQLFSRMKYTKSSARSALTDEHLQAVLRIATTHVASEAMSTVTLNIIMDLLLQLSSCYDGLTVHPEIT